MKKKKSLAELEIKKDRLEQILDCFKIVYTVLMGIASIVTAILLAIYGAVDLKINGIKLSFLDDFSKILSYAIISVGVFLLIYMLICHFINRTSIKIKTIKNQKRKRTIKIC